MLSTSLQKIPHWNFVQAKTVKKGYWNLKKVWTRNAHHAVKYFVKNVFLKFMKGLAKEIK